MLSKRLFGYSRAGMAAQEVVVDAETHKESGTFNTNLDLMMVILKRFAHLICQRHPPNVDLLGGCKQLFLTNPTELL